MPSVEEEFRRLTKRLYAVHPYSWKAASAPRLASVKGKSVCQPPSWRSLKPSPELEAVRNELSSLAVRSGFLSLAFGEHFLEVTSIHGFGRAGQFFKSRYLADCQLFSFRGLFYVSVLTSMVCLEGEPITLRYYNHSNRDSFCFFDSPLLTMYAPEPLGVVTLPGTAKVHKRHWVRRGMKIDQNLRATLTKEGVIPEEWGPLNG